MRRKKIFAICLTVTMMTTMLAGCKAKTKDPMDNLAKCGEVKDYVGLEYVPESREVTQEEIDEAVSEFCEENSETTKDTESAIKEGDVVNINYVETINGSEQDSNNDEDGYELTIGEETLAPEVDDKLIGQKAGQNVTVNVKYPDDYEDITLAGMEAVFDITINYISVTTVPEYTDDLVKKATDGEYTTAADYTAHLTEDLQNEANEEADEADKTSILDAAKEKAVFIEYPEKDVQEYMDGIVQNINSNAESFGIDFQTCLLYFYGYENEQEFLEFLQETVTSVMQEKIVVAAIAKQENLIATEDDIQTYKNKLMEENEIDEAGIEENYSAEDLRFFATEENVVAFLLENAVQVEASEEETEEETEEDIADEDSDSSADEAEDE